ncbi:hypothetical protein NOU13_12040 [Rhodococcus erythropolis]|uniref:hypothetical protein n=1 Tax=Rhodococcus erythropolis TaxID=1833 RepID=UPI00210CBB34|nr:hypothetical protein [Rhodococcus erythropolis]MCQ4125229.1 hypothetical protein [Rhodococcus erythropolis]
MAGITVLVKAVGMSLRTDLELARQDNRSLRQEIARLKTILRERLGEQLEAESSHSLRQRIDELTDANVRYQNENLTLTSSNEDLTTQLRTHEADLTATRTSLRRMIREQTSEISRESGEEKT